MKKIRRQQLRKPVTPDLLVSPSSQDGDLGSQCPEDRGNWTGRLDFLLSCIGYCVGLGNVWRFPYRAYTNGGGAFLVPYFIMLAICGIPIFFMELSLGQFSSLGPLAVWKISPLFKGIGMGTILIVSLVAIYYNMIIAYVLFYLFASLTSDLPWQHCGNWWNTDLCLDHRVIKAGNTTLPVNISNTVSPSEEYWSRYVLHIQGSSGIGDPGRIRWNLCLCLLLSWTIVYLCILKGVKSSGKVVYFTATFPYLILVMLLIRGVTLEGAWKGIRFYLTPQFDHLLSSKFAFMETIVTAVTDEFPYYLRPKKAFFSAVICTGLFLMGLILTTEGGMYWLVLLDDYSAGFGLMVVVITTCLVVTRVYGMKRFCRDIHMMLGFQPGPYFRACWMVLSPATMMALLVYNIIKYQPSEYGSYRFPAWAEALGILMGLCSCLMIPAGMLMAVLQEEGTLWERFQQASRPTMDWGPSLEENRTGTYVANLAGSQSPKPLMVHMRKYGGITSYENTAIEVDQEIEEEEEESMM
ncbi:sodium-dependent proline transporter isoform X2 [Numida meleagris]|uniref:sodium-dependent proline transporter isoform X2 n=1 Tax=Numida meleagris TaxID=8996 RepID=UPI000B3D9EA8|nr:sodium-dependent proline transporter isoform X2 [Numida meleagris]